MTGEFPRCNPKGFSWLLAAAATGWLVIALACNVPTRQVSTQRDLTAKELRQTLAAMAEKTPSPTVAPEQTGAVSVEAPVNTVDPFANLVTATPENIATGVQPTGAPPVRTPPGDTFNYQAQAGDTLEAVLLRFGVSPDQINSDQQIPVQGLISPGQRLVIANVLPAAAYPSALLPDSEMINSPSAVDFDLDAYVVGANGYLSQYVETFQGEQLSGVEAVQRVATESSINPRLLLALLELRSHWVTSQVVDPATFKYPIGFHASGQTGLYRELVMAATHLNISYYGWRLGTVTEMKFQDGSRERLSPDLNAGSVAVQYLLAKFYEPAEWKEVVYGPQGFQDTYQQMFGNPWDRAAVVEPLFLPGLAQPALELPFTPGERWALTGGAHPSWKTGSPRGALDFAPVTGEEACTVSRAWVTASAGGVVARSARNVVALDLDGDGYEQTGWVVIYMHVADKDRIPVGTWVQVDDQLGHPSCEGGTSTGTHVHVARKYNGEWITTEGIYGGPLPFTLSGWVVYAGEKNYEGEMHKDDLVVISSTMGQRKSIIIR